MKQRMEEQLAQQNSEGKKRILITGSGSYIGTMVDRYLTNYGNNQSSKLYETETISVRGESWEDCDFSRFHSIFHVAGIAHADVGNVSEERKTQYYQVNCDLAVKTAQKARAEGVKQFIYMSSIIVYGDSAPVGQKKHITRETVPAPANFYGDSKWQAEQKLRALETDKFQVAILRPPMIYGRGSKGNYPLLSKLAEKLPVFPAIRNERSMLYVENLAEFVRLLIDCGAGGLYFPQNREYASTAEVVRVIGEVKGRKIWISAIWNPLVWIGTKIPGKISRLACKAFGTLTIDPSLSEKDISGYQIFSLRESIRRTEQSNES